MLYIEDRVVKVGGVMFPGLVKSIEVSKSATIDEVEDESGKSKSKQATGYDDTKISIEMILEATKNKTAIQQLELLQRLFKANGQKKAKVYRIVCADTAARNISKVYFKSLTHKRTMTESKLTVSIEFWEYNPTVIAIKKSTNSKKTGNSNSKKTSKTSGGKSNISKEYSAYLQTQRGKAPKIKSKTSKTPAKDTAKPKKK